jgi:hypothetical protein
MKNEADKKRSERSFQIGNMVYLRLQPYVQASLAPRSHHKLCLKYFGPYKVLAKVGTVAYKLELPPSSTIHPRLVTQAGVLNCTGHLLRVARHRQQHAGA